MATDPRSGHAKRIGVMKIAISGTSGTGKTTLAQALGKALDLPVIPEDMMAIVQAGERVQEGVGRPDADIEALHRPWFRACQDWLNERAQVQSRLPGFIADRWALDLLQYWLVHDLSRENDAPTMRLIKHVMEQARLIDCLVVPSLLDVRSAPTNEMGMVRQTRLVARLRNQALIRGLIEQLLPVRTIYLPSHPQSVEERVETVLEALRKPGISKG